ncbi:MAG: lactate utilization protein [Patescibacteria group bacterium]|nr:lactate utilization protein [Patescibacteria group bacterium]
MSKWDKLPNQETINKTVEALAANGINAKFVQNGEEARKEVFALIPKGAEIMNMTSVTLDTLGIAQEIVESGRYNSVRKKLTSMDKDTQGLAMLKLGAAPEWVIGSIHAITEDGHVLIASQGGSQLPAYVFGSAHVIWVAGAQKIVKNNDEGIKRIYEHCLPLEIERAKKVYGKGSSVNKILIIDKEVKQNRIDLIIVGEVLGF